MELPEEKGGAGLDELERRVGRRQAAIVARLAELGEADVDQMTLANALAARLAPAQIDDIASRDDVKFVRLNREEQVTT